MERARACLRGRVGRTDSVEGYTRRYPVQVPQPVVQHPRALPETRIAFGIIEHPRV